MTTNTTRTFKRDHIIDPFDAVTGVRTKVIIQYPRAFIARLSQYYPGQHTFIPRKLPFTSDNPSLRLDSIDAVADFLLESQQRSNHTIVIHGHADPSGSSGRNQEITLARAQSVRAFLLGDEATWVEGTTNDDSEIATREFLEWLFERFSWPVHPGDEPVWNPQCDAAVSRFRNQAKEHVGQPGGSSKTFDNADWKFAFILMEEALLESLHGEADLLATIREQLNIPEEQAMGCGEAMADKVIQQPEHQRRVELALLEDTEMLEEDQQQPGSSIYADWGRKLLLESSPRTGFTVGVRSNDGHPLCGVPYTCEFEGAETKGVSSMIGEINRSRVPQGPFRLDLHDPIVLTAHKGIHKVRSAVEQQQPMALFNPLGQLVNDEEDSAGEMWSLLYKEHYGTDLAEDALEISKGKRCEVAIRALLTSAGLLE